MNTEKLVKAIQIIVAEEIKVVLPKLVKEGVKKEMAKLLRENKQLKKAITPKQPTFMDNNVEERPIQTERVLSKNPIVFVGKKELVKIPIFGFFYKRAVIMVDRSNPESRKRVFAMAKKRLQGGTSIGIFPEGLVPTEDVILAPFKNGAFSLAIQHQIPIIPQSYYDCKRLFSWDFLKGGIGTFRIRQHQFIETKGLQLEDTEKLKEKTFQVLYNELSSDSLYMKDTKRTK